MFCVRKPITPGRLLQKNITSVLAGSAIEVDLLVSLDATIQEDFPNQIDSSRTSILSATSLADPARLNELSGPAAPICNIQYLEYMKAVGALIPILFLMSCGSQSGNCYLPEEDRIAIRNISDQYANSWVNNDTLGVMDLFSEDAVIFPSGLEPYRGHDAITGFWWPADGSRTTVHSYTIVIDEIYGCGDMAYSTENGSLSFSYVKDDFEITKQSRSYAITTYEKQNGTWRIVRRIWTDVQ